MYEIVVVDTTGVLVWRTHDLRLYLSYKKQYKELLDAGADIILHCNVLA